MNNEKLPLAFGADEIERIEAMLEAAETIVDVIKAESTRLRAVLGKVTGKKRGRRRYGNELSPAEIKVLTLAKKGLDNAAIAERLGVESRTIRFHLINMYRKTGVASRDSLLANAVVPTKPLADLSSLGLPSGSWGAA